MAKLPFIVAPKAKSKIVKIGNEDTGIIEIEKRGYLTVAEKSFVDSVMQSSDAVGNIVKLANTVARKKKIQVEKAYNIIISIVGGGDISGVAANVSEEFSEEISQIQSEMVESMQRKAIAAATVLIKSRVNEEWQLEDTMELQPEMISLFSEFYDSEEQKIEAKQEAKDEIEEAAEIVGK